MSGLSRFRAASALIWLAATALVLVAIGGLGWRVSDGTWHRVVSPSMGTEAPVGSLLWVRPVQIEDLQVGDFITFRQPTNPAVTTSHRVYEINDDGTITTKGEIPAPDPWRLTQNDLVGEVVHVSWGVGAVVQALPVVVVGLLALAALRLMVRPRWRAPLTLVGIAVVLATAIIVYRPLVSAQQIAAEPTDSGATLTFVGTGLLPTRVSEPSGDSVVVKSGHVGTLKVPAQDGEGGIVPLSVRAAVAWWWWLVLGSVFLIPAAVALRRRTPAVEGAEG